MYRSSTFAALTFVGLCLSACGGPAPADQPDAAIERPDGNTSCSADGECDDGLFCNGSERCEPGDPAADALGCVDAAPPACPDACVESERRCSDDCDTDGDADGDGHRSIACMGDDCDDDDPLRYPGAVEICDSADHDEDCDPLTYGFRDIDSDTYPDARCCNVDDAGGRHCGSDCNDSRPSIFPGRVESCDGDDNDCDMRVDEGALRVFFIDDDDDGRGDETRPPLEACFVPDGYAEVGGDCDDTESAVHTGAPEVCDAAMLDEDCDGVANPALLCTCSGAETRMCMRPGVCGSAGIERCAAGSWGACSISPVSDVCNGLDDDCDGDVDEGLRVTCFDDPDDDGWAASGAASALLCPVGGRAAVGGCSIGYTNRIPFAPDLDCDDTRAGTHPSAPETCNAIDDDCDGNVDEGLMTVVRYIDADGDGAQGSAVMRCEGDPGSIAVSRDCNESDPQVYFGATEICDGIDNNCSLGGGAAGGPDALEDRDGDLFAPTDALCAGGPYPRTDCNDDPAMGGAQDNPIQTEICSGRDTDCDGSVDEDPEAFDSCTAPAASAGCAGDGTCRLFSCDLGYGDCNGLYADGCERDLRSSSAHCGGCGIACGGGSRCISGLCERMVGISAGANTTCLLLSQGSVSCVGRNNAGPLGDGTRADRSYYAPVLGLTDAIAVVAGGDHTCAVRGSGAVSCWGENADGRLGDGTMTLRTTPVAVSALGGSAAQLALGSNFTCARMSTGSVRCWGDNAQGQLGDGTTTRRLTPVTVSGISTATAISAAGLHACALLADGSVRCWGDNTYGELGNGMGGMSTTPIAVTGVTSAVEIGVGGSHACARLADQTLVCWGNAANGRLGEGTTSGAMRLPAPVMGLSGVTELALGSSHTCAVHSGGQLSCWGVNTYGQLGDGTTAHRALPLDVTGVDEVVQTVVGHGHTCVRRPGDRLECWGRNTWGQLGNGSTASSLVPVFIAGLRRAAEVSVQSSVVCARGAAGDVACWGSNSRGQLGTNHPGSSSRRPVFLTSALSAVSVDAGGEFVCAVEPAGTLACWGGTPSSPVPAPLPGVSDGLRVRASLSHACVLRATGELACWGANSSGQLGDGTATPRTTPATVAGLSDVRALGLSRSHTCAVRADGHAFCFGANNGGQIGAGTTGGTIPTPREVIFYDDFVDINAANGFTCGLRAVGELVCWGVNASGQLGDGTTTARSTPAPVMGLPARVLAFDLADAGSVCALIEGGALYCWGANGSGQLGIGNQIAQSLPRQVMGYADFTSVTTGNDVTCGVRDAGRALACWGVGGLLGDGTITSSSVPVDVLDLP